MKRKPANDNFALRMGYVLAGLFVFGLIGWAAIACGLWYVGKALSCHLVLSH